MKKIFTIITALILFGSLTVVQATNYFYRGTQNTWGSTLMTTSTDGYYAYFSAQGYNTLGSNNNFKISTSTDSWDYNSSYVTRGFNGTDIRNSEGNKSIGLNWDQDNVCIYCTSDFYVLIYFPNTTINTTNNPIICASTTLPDNSTPPAPPTIKMHGNFLGDWNTTAAFDIAEGNATASLSLNITTKGTKKFGVRIGSDDNWTSNGAAITRASASAEIVAGSGDCSLNADIPGEYIFTWTYESNTLSVTYPELPEQFVAFNGLSAEILKGTEVNFAATSTGITNPVYTYYVKPASGEYGSAVTSYTFDAEGSFTVKVTVEGDNTVAPIVEEQNVSVYATHTFTSGQKLYVDFSAMTEGAKGVNYPSADAANANAYDEGGAGKFITVTFTADVTWSTLNDFIKTEKAGWAGLKFTVPGTGQNCVRVAADGASYTWDTYVDLTTDFYLVGSLVGWESTDYRFMKATSDATVASTTVNITEYSNISFKLKENGEWRSCEGTVTLDKDHNTVTIANENGNNIGMTPYAAGDYIFTLNLSTRELTVTYPDGEQMPIPQNIFLAGQMNSWATDNNAYKFTVSGDVATLELKEATALEAMHDYEFKLVYNGTYLGANYDFKYYWRTDVVFSSSENSNAKIYTFKEGTYTLTYKISTGELSIVYPATSATDVTISQYEYATLYSATAFDVPAEVEAYIISGVDGIKLTMERIYRIPANTGVLLHAPQGTYPFYEGDGRWMDAPASNLLKGSTTNETIDNDQVHYVLSYDTENQVGFYWPYGTGAAQGVGSFENNAGKAYVEIPADEQPVGVIARRGFPFRPTPQVATDLEQVPSYQVPSTKVLIDGQLFIIRDGMLFNAQGARVQ